MYGIEWMIFVAIMVSVIFLIRIEMQMARATVLLLEIKRLIILLANREHSGRRYMFERMSASGLSTTMRTNRVDEWQTR